MSAEAEAILASISEVDFIWLVYRNAIRKHIERDHSDSIESEDQYRARAEKAGLVAVVAFVAKAFQVPK